MSALFICPRCRATGLERRYGTDHDVFTCRSCGAEYPLEPTSGPQESPTRRTTETARRKAAQEDR